MHGLRSLSRGANRHVRWTESTLQHAVTNRLGWKLRVVRSCLERRACDGRTGGVSCHRRSLPETLCYRAAGGEPHTLCRVLSIPEWQPLFHVGCGCIATSCSLPLSIILCHVGVAGVVMHVHPQLQCSANACAALSCLCNDAGRHLCTGDHLGPP